MAIRALQMCSIPINEVSGGHLHITMSDYISSSHLRAIHLPRARCGTGYMLRTYRNTYADSHEMRAVAHRVLEMANMNQYGLGDPPK